MARHRFGVALVVPPPLAVEVQALRRALGDPALGRVPPHLTVVPPVNVRHDERDAVLRMLRDAAAAVEPFDLTIGPPASFLPHNPVVYLEVGLEVDRVHRLRSLLFRPPLERDVDWPYVPHVTVADGVDEAGVDAALRSLQRFASIWRVTDLHLLEWHEVTPGRHGWRVAADARLGGPDVVGRGGLELALHPGAVVPPDAGAAFDLDQRWSVDQLVVTARRGDEPVGIARGRVAGGLAYLDTVRVPDDVRREGIGTHLVRAVEREAQRRGADVVVGPAHGFLLALGWRETADLALQVL